MSLMKTNAIFGGLGGGSPIDTAKAIAIMSTNEGPISNYMGANKLKIRTAYCGYSDNGRDRI